MKEIGAFEAKSNLGSARLVEAVTRLSSRGAARSSRVSCPCGGGRSWAGSARRAFGAGGAGHTGALQSRLVSAGVCESGSRRILDDDLVFEDEATPRQKKCSTRSRNPVRSCHLETVSSWGVMRHDVAGARRLARAMWSCSNVPFITDVRTLSMKCAPLVTSAFVVCRHPTMQKPMDRLSVCAVEIGSPERRAAA